MKIKGSGIYTDANGKSHRIIGIDELSDDEKLQDLKVSGNISFHKISCEEISVSGKCNGGSINAQVLKLSGNLSFDDISCVEANISGRCEGKSISAKNFSASGKIEMDSLNVAENLKLSGKPQINSLVAEKVSIGASDGFIGEIKCKRLKVFDGSVNFAGDNFEKFFDEVFSFGKGHVQIKSIDAEKVALENCKVEVIRCQDALIGSNCAIEKLFVAGECKVADDSTVNETIHI